MRCTYPSPGTDCLRARKLGLNNDALNISRGLPYNVTTEKDLKLWGLVQRIRADDESRNALISDVDIVKNYREKRLPTVLHYIFFLNSVNS